MSDALHDHLPESQNPYSYEGSESCNGDTRERAVSAAADFDRVVDMLPRLGTVLWLYRAGADTAFPRARITPRGVVLFEHPALSVLADCCSIDAVSTLTSRDGLREWLEFRDAQGNACAKLFLLPDTDYWAWDAMLRRRHPAPATPVAESVQANRSHWGCLRAALSALRARDWQARAVRLPLLRLIGLRVLGLRHPDTLSPLSVEVSRAIGGDERANWTRTGISEGASPTFE